MKVVVKLLTDISESDPPDSTVGDVQMYLNAINFEFLLCLEVTTPVFQVTALASDSLQQKDLDHLAALKVVDGVLDTLNRMRSEEEFKHLFMNASEKAESQHSHTRSSSWPRKETESSSTLLTKHSSHSSQPPLQHCGGVLPSEIVLPILGYNDP